MMEDQKIASEEMRAASLAILKYTDERQWQVPVTLFELERLEVSL